MNKIVTIFLFFLVFCASLTAQKTLQIPHLQAYPVLDGRLDDSCWVSASEINDFTSSTPVFGETPPYETKVKVFYTEEAIYVSAYCISQRVRADRSFRDDLGTGDYFQVGFDTWHDGQNAFVFTATAGNAQADARVSATGTDLGWNAIWQSKAIRHDDGWSVEMRIPYESLRFPRGNQGDWGLQFSRFDRKTGYLSTWSPQSPLIGDLVLQYGVLKALGDVRQERRISVEVQNSTWRFKLPWGYKNSRSDFSADAKIGLNSASTLDVAILPSFGMTFFKNELAGFERFYYDRSWFSPIQNRQFFREESSLFQKGNFFDPAQVVFGELHRDKLDSVLLGVTGYYDGYPDAGFKYSTRTKNNIGFGAYTSIIGEAGANIGTKRISLQKPSSYSMLTAEKALKNNSFVGVSHSILTTGTDYVNHASALAFRLRDQNNVLEISGNAVYRPITLQKGSLDYRLKLAKANGHWQWAFGVDRFRFNAAPTYNRLPFAIFEDIPTILDANFLYQDFSLADKRLNIKYYGRLHSYSFPMFKQMNTSFIDAGFQVLDKKFRTWDVSFSSKLNQSNAFITYSFENDTDTSTVTIPLFFSNRFTFISDSRKKFTSRVVLIGGRDIRNKELWWDFTIVGQWRLSHRRAFDVTYRQQKRQIVEFYNILNLQERSVLDNSITFSYMMMPISKLQINVFLTPQKSKIRFNNGYLDKSGRFIENPQYEYTDEQLDLIFGGSLRYNFSNVCQVSLAHSGSFKNEDRIVGGDNSLRTITSTTLSVIWFAPIQKQQQK